MNPAISRPARMGPSRERCSTASLKTLVPVWTQYLDEGDPRVGKPVFRRPIMIIKYA